MNVDIAEIKHYILSFETVSFHMVQEAFSLSYGQVREIFAAFEQQGIVEFESGFSYKVHKPRVLAWPPARRLDDVDVTDVLLLRAIWNCILTDNVSASGVQRSLSISYDSAYGLIEKMDKLGLIDYGARKVLITADEYIEKFGAALGLT
ncbi:MAG: hypothetical protein K2K13_05755 [Clostridiales bacterium]|nr:hypothetical protein [Clostridiales bacterium]